MSTDLTKLILNSANSAFMNNKIVTGTFTISGSHTAGTNIKTFTKNLGITPDLTDISFNGPADSTGVDPRPSTGWFKSGAVYEQSANSGGGIPFWVINSSINGTTLTVTATYTQTYTGTYTTPSMDFSYRVIDYSVF